MNLKRRFKNLNIRSKSTQSKFNTQKSTTSLKVEILRTGIVFSILLICNISYSQCTVFDLPDTTQNKIVKAFIDLKECEAKSVENGKRVIDLMISNELLTKENQRLNETIIKGRKWPWIAGAVGFVGGFFIKSQIK